jgi:hypothetical protein
MHFICPQCQKVNAIAGYGVKPTTDGRKPGGNPTVENCQFCGTSVPEAEFQYGPIPAATVKPQERRKIKTVIEPSIFMKQLRELLPEDEITLANSHLESIRICAKEARKIGAESIRVTNEEALVLVEEAQRYRRLKVIIPTLWISPIPRIVHTNT